MSLAELLLNARLNIAPKLWRPIINFFWLCFWRKEEILESFSLNRNVFGFRFSERGTIIRLVAEEFPYRTLLEAGCGVGQNLSLISRLTPSVSITGVDLSAKALLEAKGTLKDSRCKNIRLVESDLSSLSQFADKSFEIVFVSAVLLYVPGDEISKVISELLRVTSRKLFILEQHQENLGFSSQHLGVFIPRPGQLSGYWLRDYKKLLGKFIDSERIEVIDVRNPKWEGEKWLQFAKVIVANVK